MDEDMLVCSCGCRFFEKKTLSEIQLKNKFLSTMALVPIDLRYFARCIYCGKYFDKDGKEIKIEEALEW